MSLQSEMPSEDNLQGSWIELHFATGSQGVSHHGSQEQIPTAGQEGDMEKMLLDAQHESSRNSSKGSSQCNSPIRAPTPLLLWREANSPQLNSPEPLIRRGSEGTSPQLNSPEPLSWKGSEANSSQSDEDFQERRREVENLLVKNADWIWDWSSRPENSPPKELVLKHRKPSASLSIRNTSVMKEGGVLSADFLKLFLPSLIISHLLAIGLGIYIGKRLTSHNIY